ncbi:hypothetical protein HDU98_001127, partial [Podochytrium sp. JEL0797]
MSQQENAPTFTLVGTTLFSPDGTQAVQITSFLASGEFAQVYAGETVPTQADDPAAFVAEKRAIKCIVFDPNSPTYCRQQQLEIDAYKTVPPHANIIKVHFLVEGDTGACVVMDQGIMDLQQMSTQLTTSNPSGIPDALLLTIWKQMITAVAHSHAHGIAHRDIKPANFVLLDDGSIALIDFGFATPHARSVQLATGTAAFLPFECQYADPSELRTYDTQKMDVWAVCVCLMYFASGGLYSWSEASFSDAGFAEFASNNHRILNQMCGFSALTESVVNNGMAIDPVKRCTATALLEMVQCLPNLLRPTSGQHFPTFQDLTSTIRELEAQQAQLEQIIQDQSMKNLSVRNELEQVEKALRVEQAKNFELEIVKATQEQVKEM